MGARENPVSAIARLRRRAFWVLWAEDFFAALAPGCGICAAYLVAALFGFGNGWAFGGVLLLALAAFGFGLARLKRPAGEKIDRRIEAASGLKHRPFADLDDAPESGDETAQALWRAHLMRVEQKIAGAKTGTPAPRAAVRDRFALRGFLLLLLLTGAVIAGPLAPARLAGAFVLPDWPFAGPVVTVWITPPAYVQAPPLLLAPGVKTISVLAGSRVSVIVDGARNPPAALLDGATLGYSALDETSHRADAVVSGSGVLAVGPWWHKLGWWRINAAAPGAPVIRLTGIGVSKGNIVGLRWNVADPFGLALFGAKFYPVGDAQGLVLKSALHAGTGDGSGSVDLTDSPYAGLPVGVVLTATNVAGMSASVDRGDKFLLPGLNLTDPTALALAGVRQHLALQPADGLNTANRLHALAMTPPSAITPSADVQLAALATALALRQVGPQDSVDRLLALEKEIEAGPDFAGEKALAASNQALISALERGLHGQSADAGALQKLMQAVEQALAQHLAAAQPAAANQSGGQKMDMSALERLAQKIAADEAAGRSAQAAQELRQLQQVLQALQSARPMTAAEAAKAAAADAAAQQISQMTKGEAAVLDQTHQGNATPGEQGALLQQLNATMQNLSQSGVPVPGLGAAGAAMKAAQGALGKQDNAGAEDNENAAITALQQAAAALAASAKGRLSIGQSSQDMPGQSQEENGINGVPDEQSDPNFSFGGENPAREIQQQIIKDDATPGVAAPVHDYYRRLLNQGPQ
jgi:hypothetical protein